MMNNLHSWVPDNQNNSDETPRTPSDDEEEDEEYDERISDFVANTIDNRSTPESHHHHQDQQMEDRAVQTAEEKSEREHRRPPVKSQSQQSNRTQHSSAATSAPSVISEDTFVMHFRQKIQHHPQPGNAAQKLNRLVNMPFRAQFGTDSRVQSSRERVVEQQRAASSLKPAFTPLLKDNEPIILGDDSPRQTPNPTRNEQQQHQQKSQQTSSSIQHQQQTTNAAKPTQLRQQVQQNENEWMENGTTASKQPQPQHHRFTTDRATQTPEPTNQFIHPPSPLSPILDHHHHQPRRNSATQHHERQQEDWRPTRTRSLSIADYPPLYDLNRRPRVPPPINVDSWALGVGHYRRMYLDNLVSRIREHEDRHAKLKAKLSRFDKQSQQELDELELMRREQELELRRRQHDERLREQEELERRIAATARTTNNNFVAPPTTIHNQSAQTHRPPPPPPPPLHSILKKPPMGGPPPPFRHTSSYSNANAPTHPGGRGVAFSSPIRSVNIYSPNQSRANSSSMMVPEETQTHQLENEPTCSQNIGAGTSENNQQQRTAHSNSSGALNRHHRLVLTNKTNNGYSHTRPFAHHHQHQAAATGMRNVQNEREKSFFRRADAWTI